jgi:hypothetical protein
MNKKEEDDDSLFCSWVLDNPLADLDLDIARI